MGWPVGSWIMRKDTASSVETAGWSLTGIRTSERRRLPDQSEGGGMTELELHTKRESESGAPLGLARGTNEELVTPVRPRIGRVRDQTLRRGRGFSRRPHLGGPDHTGERIGWGRF